LNLPSPKRKLQSDDAEAEAGTGDGSDRKVLTVEKEENTSGVDSAEPQDVPVKKTLKRRNQVSVLSSPFLYLSLIICRNKISYIEYPFLKELLLGICIKLY
jgi:hypothetical protein